MNKFTALLSAVIALTTVSVAHADDKTAASTFPGAFTANVALTSDYTFRGISQSNEGPAIQGGFDYTYADPSVLPVGVYLGVWGSNVDFNDGDEANVEVDLYGGISGTIAPIASDWKFGAIYYAYPGADSDLNYDYVELAASLTHDFGQFALTGSLNYSPDYFGSTGAGFYTAVAGTYKLPYDFTLNGHAGWQTVADTENYFDWSVGLGYSWNGFGLNLNYIDTDLSEPTDCLDGCSARVVFSVSRAF